MTTLAELRLANLREQKKSAQSSETAAPNPVSAPPPVAPSVESKAVIPPQEDLVLAQYLTDAEQAPIADLKAISKVTAIATESADSRLIARVHDSLAHKMLHPTGAKATVDMSPALFHRAKRYCLDHGNVTLRQLFLDLMTAFLDEEGY
jgi:hypothetical protein